MTINLEQYETHPSDFRRHRVNGRLQQDNKNRQRYEHFDIQRETGGGNVGHRLLRGTGRPSVVGHCHQRGLRRGAYRQPDQGGPLATLRLHRISAFTQRAGHSAESDGTAR